MLCYVMIYNKMKQKVFVEKFVDRYAQYVICNTEYNSFIMKEITTIP